MSPATGIEPALRDAVLATAALLAAVYLGSWRLAHVDPALAGYLAALLVSFFCTTWRVSRFWRRPPAAFFGRVLAAALVRARPAFGVARRAVDAIAAQRFIARRSRLRWAAHMLLAWGTLVGFAIALPLVCGWLRFAAPGARSYAVIALGVPVAELDVDGPVAWLAFNALNLAGMGVLAGAAVLLALRLRGRGAGGSASEFHLRPLLLLAAVAATGLALPLAGRYGSPLALRLSALAHEATVIALLVALPHGKLIHVLVRPLHVGAMLARAEDAARVHCVRCSAALAPAAQLDAVEAMLADRGLRFAGWQRSCPRCRRRALAVAQSSSLDAQFQPRPAAGPASIETRRAA